MHPRYAQNTLKTEELDFAKALDAFGIGVWMRNPARGDGYGIPLPMKVGTSSTFYPDFLWWVGDSCFAIDPTGAHILQEKIRGKLLSLDRPKIVLVTKGRVAADWSSVEDVDGYTVVRPRKNRDPAPEYVPSLQEVLTRLATQAEALKDGNSAE